MSEQTKVAISSERAMSTKENICRALLVDLYIVGAFLAGIPKDVFSFFSRDKIVPTERHQTSQSLPCQLFLLPYPSPSLRFLIGSNHL